MLDTSCLRGALSRAAPQIDPQTIVIEVGTSEVRVGFAGALHAACRLPAFVSRSMHAEGLKTLFGWESFDSRDSSGGFGYYPVFAAHPAHCTSSGGSLDLLMLLLDEAFDRALKARPHTSSNEDNSSSCCSERNLLLVLPLPGEPQLLAVLLRWAFEQRRFRRSGRWGPQSLDWRDITRYKETQCYVSLDPALDLHLHRNHKQLRPLFTCSEFVLDRRHGSVVQPWSETFLIPEVLFSPQLLLDSNLTAVAPSMDHKSISEMIIQCFKRSSVCEREGWLKRICLVGGTAQLPNFAERVNVLPCEDRQLAAFHGALLFGTSLECGVRSRFARLVARQEPEAWLSRGLYERTESLEKRARQMALYS
ncbi:actin-like family [Cyclospora cayetanensis]|uniref:Actin-like family n=1 Tax=Cyclospora cayetanensis TaxID=88456 RepID=A0A1D3D141_9EIME|nr:actin-like family [Cyclospora cayetanensis]